MDYHGQSLCEWIYQIVIAIAAVFGFCYGYYIQSFAATIYCVLAGATLSALICVPDWPTFNTRPLKWQTPTPTLTPT